MKKLLFLVFVIIMTVAMLAGCTSKSDTVGVSASEDENSRVSEVAEEVVSEETVEETTETNSEEDVADYSADAVMALVDTYEPYEDHILLSECCLNIMSLE